MRSSLKRRSILENSCRRIFWREQGFLQSAASLAGKRVLGYAWHQILPYLFLAALAVFACWFFVGRHGMFASKTDWISQHSVFPDYFRQQFYETGELFPEFAAGLGGGQNIYHFSYYGLYSPVILPSYLLPSVKMSDYLMAASVLCLAVSGMLLYHWLGVCGFSSEVCLGCAVMFLLAGPFIYQSYRQVMFVSYMPFLCMALTGAERYWKTGKTGIYTAGIFLMIMTSFYFSIAGILAVMMYGVGRYRKVPWKWPLLHVMIPVLAAVCASAVLLVPTAYVLMSGRGGSKTQKIQELLMPDLSFVRFACSGYGIGLTTGILTVLLIGLFYKDWKERLLSAGCLAIVLIPAFSWLLNGGLYVRDKSMIPFLPLLCYLTAVYLEKQKRRETGFWISLAGYALTVVLSAVSWMRHNQGISTQRYAFILSESILLLVFFLIYWKRRCLLLLMLPPVICLALFGTELNQSEGDIIGKSRYESVTDPSWKSEISEILEKEQGLCRLEQDGSSEEKKDNINRVWDRKQWITSVYSSAYQEDYQNFRENVFQTEQPFRNQLMQSASDNPLFRKLMGVKYSVGRAGDTGDFECKVQEHAAPVIYATDRLISRKQYEQLPFPYNQTVLMQYAVTETGGFARKNGCGQLCEPAVPGVHPPCSPQQVSSRYLCPSFIECLCSGAAEQAVLDFKHRCPSFIQCLCSGGHGHKAENDLRQVYPADISIAEDDGLYKETGGYSVRSGKDVRTYLDISGQAVQAYPGISKEKLLFVQFEVQNHRRNQDVTVDIQGVRNRLSARNHIYYNGNTVFTYVVRLLADETKAEIVFGKGDYLITDIRGFVCDASILAEDDLYQSEFQPDWTKTKGNRISGWICTENTGYLVTSIPYDEGFTIRADGMNVPVQKVNTAFLGAALSKGWHRIEIVYHAPGLAAGKLLSCIGLGLWAAVWMAGRKRVRILMQL